MPPAHGPAPAWAAARRVLKRSAALTACVRAARRRLIRALYRLSPAGLYRLLFRQKTGRWPDLEAPRSFDEKLGWLMLYWRHPLKTRCSDKYGLRSYAQEQGLEHLLPELLGVYEQSRDIDFSALPDRFVLKCTHGCKFNIICTDKHALDTAAARHRLDRWLQVPFDTVFGEVQYAGITPRIICEEFLDGDDGGLPHDYKVYCFDGRAYCTMVCTDRDTDGYSASYHFYDRDWERTLPYDRRSCRSERKIPRPAAYSDIITAAERLAAPFPFVRMDFYSIGGRPVIGEMSFTPNGCIDTDLTREAQEELGALITLPEKL